MLCPGNSVGVSDNAITSAGTGALCFFDKRPANMDGELTSSTTGYNNKGLILIFGQTGDVSPFCI